MRFALEVLRGTPGWVFVLLGFLAWQGAQARRVRTVAVWRPFVVPVVFLPMGMLGLVAHRADGAGPVLAWAGAAAVMFGVGLVTGPRPLAVDRVAGLVTLPGSWVPLVRNVVVFSLQYGFAVAGALHPERHGVWAAVGRAVSGATAGYFVGWGVGFWRHWREGGDRGAAGASG